MFHFNSNQTKGFNFSEKKGETVTRLSLDLSSLSFPPNLLEACFPEKKKAKQESLFFSFSDTTG